MIRVITPYDRTVRLLRTLCPRTILRAAPTYCTTAGHDNQCLAGYPQLIIGPLLSCI